MLQLQVTHRIDGNDSLSRKLRHEPGRNEAVLTLADDGNNLAEDRTELPVGCWQRQNGRGEDRTEEKTQERFQQCFSTLSLAGLGKYVCRWSKPCAHGNCLWLTLLHLKRSHAKPGYSKWVCM